MQNPTEITLSSEMVEQLSPLDLFGASRFRDIEHQLQQRSLVEQRWLDDLRQYRGEYEPDFIKELERAKKSQAFVNITREKTDAWAAQMGDMLFPVDDKNYGIAPSPDPKLSMLAKGVQQGMDGQQQPTTEAQQAAEVLAAAQAAATAMEKTIDDQLIACDYNAESRRMLHYAAKIGTGIIKGPIVESAIKQAWLPSQDGSWSVEIVKDLKPGARCVLPWDFVPDMGATRWDDCEFVYEREYMTKKELRRLLNLESMGFISTQVEKLLAQDPSSTRTRYAEFVDQIRYLCGLNPTNQDSRFEVWTYHGPIPVEVLQVAGVDITEMEGREFDGVAIFSGDVILKVTINPMDTMEWPYSVYVCEPDEGSIFGLSMPYLMRHPQRIINSAWRAMLDNAAKTVGPQVVVNKRLISPVDGNWEATPFKVWEMDSNQQYAEVQKAFGVFHFDSRQSDMANILQLALSLLDREAGVPMISQGEQGQVTPTLGGMSMLMNAANAVRRQQVKEYDDNITKPMIRRFYNWNMQFGEDAAIKGDFEVQARGTSALLVKEIQTAQLTQILDKYTQNPTFAPMFKPYEAMKTLFQSMHIDNAKVLRSQEEYDAAIKQQQEAGQQDPQLVKLQMEQQLAQAKFEHETQLAQMKSAGALQMAQMQASLKQQELQFSSQFKLATMQLQHEDSQRRERIELMKLAQNKQMSQAQLMIELEKLDKEQAHDTQKFMAEVKMKQILPPNGNYGLE
ncbi:TPA: hypothetical protein P2N04_001090 [Aeromonas salmonicida]|uniref:Portal protein n=1 Tax=Aeromonas salmonicida subsp. salmonicida TaxID=29491 RepID=A0A8F3IUV0_AERSS|nr:hypothetical protein [Aeromonas salmonicida]MBM9522616.1 hypothetical protein [Aeromonas salmonicida subsp. salmonicida]QWY91825.1 hypothetical protein [Aeromonas salmonicida subsp. salmonicida]HDN9804035.1 hypothetical protein [Aeromonas salmonicida]HDO0961119.1 hypothetical protein [Aeromonas salmonicida]HDO0965746.1 hypothetical protein [Aeromonas salmonicida]